MRSAAVRAAVPTAGGAGGERVGARATAGARVAAVVEDGGGLLLALPLWWWWALDEAGYPAAVWLPGVVWLAAVLVLGAATGRLSWPPGRAARVGLTALGLLALWALASVAWADDRGAAWHGGERWALYALACAVPLLWPPTERGLGVAVGGIVGTALLGLGGAVVSGLGDGTVLDDGRLAAPAGYPNATAALLLAGALAALPAAGAARTARAAAAFAGAAGTLLAATVLTQSRGGVAAAAVGITAALVLGRAPLRVLAALAGAAVALVLGWDTLTDLRRAALVSGPSELPMPAPHDALTGAVLVCLAAGVAAASGVLAVVGIARRLAAASGPSRPARTTGRRVRLAVAATAAAAGVLVLGVLAATGWLGDRWTSFKTPDYTALEAGSTRFSGDLGSNRYDYWRVAADVVRDRPLTGVGADGFAAPYLADRRSDMTPRYAHDWWLETAATLGLVGLAALLVGLGALTLAALRRRGPWTAAAVVPLVVVAVQASADWSHTFPAATAPALAVLAAAAAVRDPRPAARAARRRGLVPALVLLGALTAITVPAWVAARLQEQGTAVARTAPLVAEQRFAQAAAWNPLAAAPATSRGAVAILHGRPGPARAAFAEAAERDPSGWFAPFVLGLLAAQDGDRARALALLDRARAANPRDTTVARLAREVRAGRAPDPQRAAAEVLGR